MPKQLRTKIDSKPAIIITRRAVKAHKLVYVARANKRVKYRSGSSRIVYIGTTKAGAKRIAQSAASKADNLLQIHGIKTLDFFTVVCSPVPGLQSWKLLERALILRFRERFGDPPMSNIIGRKMKWDDELKYFTHKKLDEIIDEHS